MRVEIPISLTLPSFMRFACYQAILGLDMAVSLPSIALFLVILIAIVDAQCVTDGFVPCLPAGSQLGGAPPNTFDDSSFWDSLQSAASTPIGRRDLVNP